MMEAVILAAILAIFATMAFGVWRAIQGPSVYDTIVGVNVVGTKTVLLIALITHFTGHADLIDVALVYALINFIAVVAILKLVRRGDLAASGEGSHD